MIRFFKKIGYVIQTVFAKIRFGNAIQVDGLLRTRGNTRIIIQNGNLSIGKNVMFNDRISLTAVAGGKFTIGDGCSLNRNCILICRDTISIGSGCYFGPNVCVYDHDHKFDHTGIASGFNTGSVSIGNNCWIGANVTILRNTTIGDGCVIGAGVIVKGDIPAHSLVTASREMNIVPIIER